MLYMIQQPNEPKQKILNLVRLEKVSVRFKPSIQYIFNVPVEVVYGFDMLLSKSRVADESLWEGYPAFTSTWLPRGCHPTPFPRHHHGVSPQLFWPIKSRIYKLLCSQPDAFQRLQNICLSSAAVHIQTRCRISNHPCALEAIRIIIIIAVRFLLLSTTHRLFARFSHTPAKTSATNPTVLLRNQTRAEPPPSVSRLHLPPTREQRDSTP